MPTALPAPGGMWVWTTRALLAEPDSADALVRFVAQHRIERVFLQLPPAEGERAAAGFVPFDGRRLGPLVGALHDAGAAVYALDGDPAYALPANHAGVLRTTERLIAYNRAAAPRERFFGVRYDVEPYLAPGFQGPRRQEILDGYVGLVAAVAAAAHAGGLRVGVDVPFWLDAPDEERGRRLSAVLDGRRAPVLTHLLSSVDDIAIMDYRTRAEGPDGVVAHAWDELDAARAAGVGVLVGLETEALADEELFTFAGAGRSGLPPERGRWIVLGPGAEEGTVEVRLVEGAGDLAALRRDTAGQSAAAFRHWPAGTPIRVPADKQSFHNLGAEALTRTAARVAAALEHEPAFLGIAYHRYASLNALLR